MYPNSNGGKPGDGRAPWAVRAWQVAEWVWPLVAELLIRLLVG